MLTVVNTTAHSNETATLTDTYDDTYLFLQGAQRFMFSVRRSSIEERNSVEMVNM